MKYDYIVAQDGSGDFTTIQEAIDAAVEAAGIDTERPVSIQVKPGIYFENCSFEGDDTSQSQQA
jgi:pectinesterase